MAKRPTSTKPVNPALVIRNPRHERFALDYARNGNAKQAYIAAGYRAGTPNTAEVGGSQLLRNTQVEARIRYLRERMAAGIIKAAIRDKNARVEALQDRWDRMKRVIEERAKDRAMRKAAGGKTGLLVRRLKQVGSGDSATVVEEFEVDTALLKEMRAHEEQAAKELGQWVEKSEVSPGGEYALTEILVGIRQQQLLADGDPR